MPRIFTKNIHPCLHHKVGDFHRSEKSSHWKCGKERVKEFPLPLSWVSIPGSVPVLRVVSLPLGGWWVPWGDIPFFWRTNDLLDYLERNVPSPVVVRGWTAEWLPVLQRRGWQCWQVGLEGRRKLTGIFEWDKNTRHAIRRGWAESSLEFIEDLRGIQTELRTLVHEALPPPTPHLQWLFRQPPDSRLRLYLARGERLWAAMGISSNRPGWVQGEWMVRHPRAPYGVLDALVDFVIREEYFLGARWFSFGEVPFLGIPTNGSTWSWVMHFSRSGISPIYNYQGLFRFKNKYVNQWQPVYLCGYPYLNMRFVAGLAQRSNALELWKTGVQKGIQHRAIYTAHQIFIPLGMTLMMPFL